MMDVDVLRRSLLSKAFSGELLSLDDSENTAIDKVHNSLKDYREVQEEEYLISTPSNWKWSRLKYVTNNHGQKKPVDDFCYIDVGTIDNKKHTLSAGEKIITVKDAPSRARKVVELGDVLYSTVRPYLHNVCIIDKQFSHKPIASTAFSVMSVNEMVLYNKFLFYWLLTNEFDKYASGDSSKGALYPAIGETDLLNGVIPLPTLSYQKKVVELLEKAFDYLEIIDFNQKLYAANKESLITAIIDLGVTGKLTEQLKEDGSAEELYVHLLSEKLISNNEKKKNMTHSEVEEIGVSIEIPDNWKWIKLGELGTNNENAFADGPFGSNLKTEHYTKEKQVRIIQLSNVGKNGWKDENEKYTTYEHLETIKRSQVKAGDIVIAKMMPAGRAIIVPDVSDAFVLSSDCVKFIPNEMLNKQYLYYAINSSAFRKQVLSKVNGIGRERTSLSKLKEYYLPIPPLAEQMRIVKAIAELLSI